MVDSCSCSARVPVAWVFLLSVLLSFQVTSVAAVVERYVAPTSNFTMAVNATLTGASTDHYFVHLSAGLYAGCGPTTIELNPGSAFAVTVIGAGEKETTIDCGNVVLTSPVFTCGTGCTAVLQNVTVTRLWMTTASPDDVGALMNALGGALVTFKSVNVTSCWTVTNGGNPPPGLTAASSVVRVAGSGTRLLIVDSIFSSNTGEIGSISALDNSEVSLSGSHFEFNKGGGGHPSWGLGGVLSLASGAFGGVSQSSFLSNSASRYGGVFYSYEGGDVSFVDVIAQDCTGFHGGVVFSLYGDDVSFVSVIAQDCSAGSYGGVVFSQGSGDLSFVNVTSQDCSAGSRGGVVSSFSHGGEVSFVDVTAQDCSADIDGGVVYSFDSGDVSFVNVIAQDCSAGSGGVVYSYGGDVSFVNVTAQDCSASGGGVVYSYDSGDVSFVTVTAQDCSAGQDGGVVWSQYCSLSLRIAVFQNSFASFDGYAFFLQSSQLVFRGVFESNAVRIIYAGRENDLDPPSTVVLERASLSCINSDSCVDLEGFSTLNASDSSIFVASGVGVFAVGASVDMINCSLGGGEGALIISLSDSVCVMNDTVLTASAGGLVLYSFSSTLNLTCSIVNASGSGLALASISGSASLVLSQLVCLSNSPIISVGTTWEIMLSVLVGSLPLSFGESATVTDSFIGSTSIGAPALACDPTTHVASSVTCGGGGRLTSPSGTCSSDTAILGAGQPNCHDACFNGSFCVPDEDDREGYWFDSLGCPRCGGPCWLGANNCNATLAYCYDHQGGGFTCECRTGFSGDGVQCEDVDECLLADACTAPRTVCLNTPGSYTCPCEPGTSLVTGLCRDLDECQTQFHDCDASAVCINTPGSFVCECLADSYGNGTVPCAPCPPLSVTQGQGSLLFDDCLCPPDYYMSSATCEACPGNSTSAAGSIVITSCFCEPYFYRDSGESIEAPCEVCPAGRFALNERQCLPCPSGSFSFENNASSCANCPAGSTTSLQGSALTCTCLPYYNSSGSGEDLVCTQSCPPGWQIAGASCQLCGLGFYSRDVNSPRCTRCPPGATTVRPNTTSWTECECLHDRIDTGGGLQACPLNCSAGTSYVSGLDQCVPCARGSYWILDTATGIGACVVCPSNSYTVDSGSTNVSACICNADFAYDEQRGWCAIQCGPGFAVQSTTCELCGPGTYSAQPNSLACAACTANALTAPGATSQSDCSCLQGYYFDAIKGECPICPPGASCPGGLFPPTAESGYFETEQGTFVKCVPDTSCSGQNECLDGYEGTLCAGCSKGYFRLDGYCRPCSGSRSAFASLALIGLLLASAALIIYNLGDDQASETAKTSFGGFFIAFNSFQIIAMFGQLEIAWPSFIRKLLAALSLFFNFNIEVVGFECFSDSGRSRGTHPFVASWIVGILAPFYVAVSLVFGYFLLVFLHLHTPYAPTLRGYKGSDLFERLRKSAGVSLVQALLLLYFPLTVSVFEAFQCVDNGTGVRVLASSRDIVCSGSVYSPLLGLGVLATLGYVFGIPACLLGGVYLLKARNSEADLYNKAEVLIGKYRSSVFWYEGVVLLRKAAVAAALLLLTPSPYVRAAAGAAVLLVSFTLNRVLAPYRLRWHNWIECSSLLSTIVFLEVGVAMQGTEWSNTGNVLVALLSLLAALAIVLGAAGYELWWAQRVWRGLSTDDVSIRVYESETPTRLHNVWADSQSANLQTMGLREELDILATVIPPPPSSPSTAENIYVPVALLPSPLVESGAEAGGEVFLFGVTSAARSSTIPHVPPPPSLGQLGAVESRAGVETVVPLPPPSETSVISWDQMETVIPPPSPTVPAEQIFIPIVPQPPPFES